MKGPLAVTFVPYATSSDAYTAATPIAAETPATYQTVEDMSKVIKRLEKNMKAAAQALAFERAAELRDQIKRLKEQALDIAAPPTR